MNTVTNMPADAKETRLSPLYPVHCNSVFIQIKIRRLLVQPDLLLQCRKFFFKLCKRGFTLLEAKK